MEVKDVLFRLRTEKRISQEELAKEQLIEFCVEHMANENWPKEQVRAHMEAVVPELKHWKNRIKKRECKKECRTLCAFFTSHSFFTP